MGTLSRKALEKLMPYYVLDILGQYPGMSGLYMSTLFSGALSTLSSGINALAANTVEDVLAAPLRKVSESTVTIIAKLAVCFYGLLAIGLAYLARSLQGPVTQLVQSTAGATGGPILGMFFLGALFPWANRLGALCGGVSALIVNVLISVLNQIYGVEPTPLHPAPMDNCTVPLSNITTAAARNVTLLLYDEHDLRDLHYQGLHDRPFCLFDVSYQWYGLIGFLVTLLIGAVTSLISGLLFYIFKRRGPS